MRFVNIRKDKFVFDDKIVGMSSSKDRLIKELDYRHFNTGGFA